MCECSTFDNYNKAMTNKETPEQNTPDPTITPPMVFAMIEGCIPNGRQFLESVNTLIAQNTFLKAENEKLKEALASIRHATYARDTDDAILHQIGEILTETGFPYVQED
jgi:hypothetical protein